MKFSTVTMFSILFTLSASSFASNDEDYKVLTILAKNCAVCHNAADHPGALFLNQARLSEPETIALMRRLIETAQMPQEHRNFKKSKDGKLLLKWLKKQEVSQKVPTK